MGWNIKTEKLVNIDPVIIDGMKEGRFFELNKEEVLALRSNFDHYFNNSCFAHFHIFEKKGRYFVILGNKNANYHYESVKTVFFLEAVLNENRKTPEDQIEIKGHLDLTYQHIIEILANADKEYQISVKVDLYMIHQAGGDHIKYLIDFLTKVVSQ